MNCRESEREREKREEEKEKKRREWAEFTAISARERFNIGLFRLIKSVFFFFFFTFKNIHSLV